jgi:hypothetical protein
MSRLVFATLVLAALGAATAPLRAEPAGPVVVELFTSQGCSSCPPADALLGELAQRPDVVALAFHVDYWDYIGWKDPYASRAFTQRQRDYAQALRLHMVYTPQMVVDGRTDVVGSYRREVEAAIANAAQRSKLTVTIESDGQGGHRAVIPAAAGEPAGGAAGIWLAVFDGRQETRVTRGENGGRTLAEYNIVREWRRIGTWNGGAVTLPLDVPMDDPDRNGCAVIVQAEPIGEILGAAIVTFGGDS